HPSLEHERLVAATDAAVHRAHDDIAGGRRGDGFRPDFAAARRSDPKRSGRIQLESQDESAPRARASAEQVPGSRFSVLGSWFLVLGGTRTWNREPGTRNQVRVCGIAPILVGFTRTLQSACPPKRGTCPARRRAFGDLV